MAIVNNVIMNGKINFEPKIYNTTKGGKMASFVLNTWTGKDKDGKSTYGSFMVKTFDTDMATIVENYGKDAKIVVAGKLTEEKYKNKEGKDVSQTVIIANYIGVDA